MLGEYADASVSNLPSGVRFRREPYQKGSAAMSTPSVSAKLTVAFDGQHWVAFFERESDGLLSVARHVFGPEPTLPEILALVSGERYARVRYMPAVETDASPPPLPSNPKRRQREVARESRSTKTSTRSQEAMKAAVESLKGEVADANKAQRIADQEDRRAKLVAKRKAKKRGH